MRKSSPGRTLLLLAAIITLGTGCFARTASKKQAAYVVNGLGMLMGGVILISKATSSGGGGSSRECGNEGVACGFGAIGDGLVDMAVMAAAGGMLGAGTVMNIVLLATPTLPDPPRDPASPPAPASGVVNAPGLKPAAVTLR